ncbi:hypothetical protein G3N55_09620 [Dissulfurirhabdus thermomarina]|uniref:Catalase n=1 Tax=Dissulfurirhabdus thermomarina TaxID=1765737 RepID=A0A6N9TUI2_DISTH|nr:putative metalloprotease CJM1_0395 family protein [Dissulfurirhabdus thermomarina]NDY43097.1 hypothetical protein [Dissulfurirhabdus thermomarina]NMX24367.1 hypothetical protein [Dissulfurirhabdus thermomarina]
MNVSPASLPLTMPRVAGQGPEAEVAHRAGAAAERPAAAPPGARTPGGEPLDRAELAELLDLRKRDAEVRRHERAHMAAGGAYVRGGATYTYRTGPDGRRYAVGGEVHIDASPEPDPEKTLRKMETVRRAALAPANPSPQDRAVAAEAAARAAEAQRELMAIEAAQDSSHQTGTESGGGLPPGSIIDRLA